MPPKSSMEIEIIIEGGLHLRGRLNRFLAPMTYDNLVRALPLSGALAVSGDIAYFQVEVRRGAEKEARRVDPGDILYWPSIPALAFVTGHTNPPVQAVKIGRLEGDPSALRSVNPGARVIVRKAAATSS